MILIYVILLLVNPYVWSMSKHLTMIKEIDGIVYVGGRNILISYVYDGNKLVYQNSNEFHFDFTNRTYLEFNASFLDSPVGLDMGPSLGFETCLNWKQDHVNKSYRDSVFDYHHAMYHTPAGNWNISDYTCNNNFIKGIDKYDKDTLWVCGTAGSIPKAFTVDRITLKFIKIVDTNLMTCARYVDEGMAVHRDSQNNLYVGSGWGLYRPDKNDPDVPENNSTILYADWRLNKNLFTLPSAMAYVLSSDVNFIDVVKETDTHLYFFGHEVNNQYGLNNQEDRNSWQSFMLRICKNDQGFKYNPSENAILFRKMSARRYRFVEIDQADYRVASYQLDASFHPDWYDRTAHLPTKHFVTPHKINFGCYIGKRPRGISDNFFWSETNVLYINKLADVLFDLNKAIKFRTKNKHKIFGCNNQSHEQIPLIGLFNSPGIRGTAIQPAGALCQLQINANIFNEIGSKKPPYHLLNGLEAKNAFEEIMLLNSITVSNFYSRTYHRINGITLYPYWNQGVFIGENVGRDDYQNAFVDVGKCQNLSFFKNLRTNTFFNIMNYTNTAWPNELPNRLSSMTLSICQFSAAELYNFNATVLIPGVEFKKVFLVADNITNYFMPKLKKEHDNGRNLRRHFSPLMILLIISNHGVLYRIVICDFDNAMLNLGEDRTSDEWRDWCIFRHTDQPYLYRQYTPMEIRERGKTYQYRASSVLHEKSIVKHKEPPSFIYGDPKYNHVKDVIRKKNTLHILTASEVIPFNMEVNCAEYGKCIDCASDPQCMWDKSNNKCIKYFENLKIPSKYIQDVLDRGFICYKAFPEASKTVNAGDVLMLNCSNSVFWRGPILWKLNGTKISSKRSKRNFLLVNDQLVIVESAKILTHKTVIRCYGVKDDQDKLYNGVEYDWENQFSEIVLNTFYVNPKENESYALLAVLIVLVCLLVAILLAILIFWIIWKYYGHLLNKRKPRTDLSDPAVTTLITDGNITTGKDIPLN